MTEQSLFRFLEEASEIDSQIANSIRESIIILTGMMIDERVPVRKKKTSLRQLHLYLQKKTKELDPILAEATQASLRKLRNELAHNNVRRDFDLAPLYPELWKAIGRLGTRLGASEIENLLAYTLDVANMKAASRGISPTKIVQLYRPIFNAKDPLSQRHLFVDLLLRLFTDGESLALLDSAV